MNAQCNSWPYSCGGSTSFGLGRGFDLFVWATAIAALFYLGHSMTKESKSQFDEGVEKALMLYLCVVLPIALLIFDN